MMRMAATARAALTKRHFLGSVSASKSSLIVSHRSHLPIILIFPSRLYARMARRSPPPARRNADVNQESESEEEIEGKMEIDLSDDDDDGDVSEEWEGFMMDFGTLGKEEDDDNPNSDGGSS